MARPLSFLLVAASSAILVIGCNQVIGIEDAYVDPSLADDTTTTGTENSSVTGSSSTDGNSSKSAGSGGTDSSSDSTSSGGGGEPNSSSSKSTSSESSDGSGGTGGGGSEESSGGGTGGESSSTDGAPVSLCDEYCDGIMEACTGADLQYRDAAQCKKICELLPEGTLGATGDNTVACRMKYVGDSRYAQGTELSAYCRWAGPAGAGRCGSSCDGYCSIMMAVCTAEQAGLYHFESEEACQETCEELPELETGYSASDPLIADGNHVECRLFHVMSAAMLDPEEHCEHAMGITLCEAQPSE